jgi:hypothetical protein
MTECELAELLIQAIAPPRLDVDTELDRIDKMHPVTRGRPSYRTNSSLP